MEILAIISLCIVYWIIGMGGFVYWWTKELDLTTKNVPLFIVAGVLGPGSWIIGYLIHGRNDYKTKIIFKKR